jgi:predicted HAD superfamily hydrolase
MLSTSYKNQIIKLEIAIRKFVLIPYAGTVQRFGNISAANCRIIPFTMVFTLYSSSRFGKIIGCVAYIFDTA